MKKTDKTFATGLMAVVAICIFATAMCLRNGDVYSFRMGCTYHEYECLPSYSDMMWNLKVWNFDTYLKPYRAHLNSLEIGQVWTDESDNPFRQSIYRFVILDIKKGYVKYSFGVTNRIGTIEQTDRIEKFMHNKIKLD